MKPNSPAPTANQAFTLPDLLVLVCTVSCLVLAVFAGHARTRSDNRGLACQSNLRRLTAAWLMYAADQNDMLVPNSHLGDRWVQGWLGSVSDDTNTVYLTDPRYAKLAPYVNGGWQLYKCPADPSRVRFGPRVRSIAMNTALGDGDKGTLIGFYARKLCQVTVPRPAMASVLLDENPATLNDAAFYLDPRPPSSSYRWMAVPGSFHDGAGSLSFADGHTELHVWQNLITFTPGYIIPNYIACPESPDFEWLKNRTTIAP